jgi:hypothetical protein
LAKMASIQELIQMQRDKKELKAMEAEGAANEAQFKSDQPFDIASTALGAASGLSNLLYFTPFAPAAPFVSGGLAAAAGATQGAKALKNKDGLGALSAAGQVATGVTGLAKTGNPFLDHMMKNRGKSIKMPMIRGSSGGR